MKKLNLLLTENFILDHTMPLYDFPLWASDPIRFPATGFLGAGWKLMAAEVSYMKQGSKAWERHFENMRKKYPRYSVLSVGGVGDSPWIAPQIIAEARSRVVAQTALVLLTTALVILDGSNFFEFGDAVAVPRNRERLEDLSPIDVEAASLNTFARDNVVFGCQFAAALSRRRYLSYAALKLRLSYQIASTHWMNLHPGYYPKEFSVSESLFDHVRMASAILLAYSAIEEMQLHPRPIGGTKEIKVGSVWDPAALADLQKRLQAAHIDITERLNWSRRGSQTRIHKSNRAAEGVRTSWTKGSVRDRSVKIEDALIEASWLRSKCSTHKYGKITRSISMYDVTNVQFLTRRLLLESVRLWKPLLRLAQM
jgi:hypothetical protein